MKISETCVMPSKSLKRLCNEHAVSIHPIFGEICHKHSKELRKRGIPGAIRINKKES